MSSSWRYDSGVPIKSVNISKIGGNREKRSLPISV